MSRVNIESKLITSNENTINHHLYGIHNDEKILYKEDDKQVVIFLKNNFIKLIRKSKEYKIVLNFKKNHITYGKYYLNDLNNNIDVKIDTKELILNNNSLHIKYDLYFEDELSDNFIYDLNWRE